MTLLALPGLVMAGANTAAASQRPAGPVATAPAGKHVTKTVPARPPSSPGAGIGAAVPAKANPARVARPLTAWSVTLSASRDYLWPRQYSSLTATAGQDVGPTPYYLRIYDQTAGAYVISCGTGTTCTTAVTQPAPTEHCYIAVVSYGSPGYPPAGEQAFSNIACVDWHGVSLTLSANPTTLPVGAASTLTATTGADIGPSPFFTEIYDATTGAWLAACGTGTSCATTVTQTAATTHEYVAYLSDYGSAFPPTGIQETSESVFVTWSNLGWRVSLTAPSGSFGPETVTATTSADVGPTPYFIEIFNENGTFLHSCATGTTCSVSFTPSLSGSRLVAFVCYYATTFPPAGAVASSNVVTTYLRIIP